MTWAAKVGKMRIAVKLLASAVLPRNSLGLHINNINTWRLNGQLFRCLVTVSIDDSDVSPYYRLVLEVYIPLLTSFSLIVFQKYISP